MTGDLLLLGLAAGLVLVVTTAPLSRAVLFTLPTWVLVPGPLVVPNPLTSALTFHRVLLAALMIAWWRAWRQRPAGTRSSPAVVLTGGMAGPLVGLGLVVALVVAVGATGPASAGTGRWLLEVVAWGDRLAALGLLALVAATLAALDDDAPWVLARALALALVATAVVAAGEVLTGRAWGQLLFSPLGSLQGLDAAAPLEMRGGLVRVRAGAEFALELGWVCVALLPAALAVAVDDPDRRWRVVGAVAVVVVPGIVLATQARTALVAVPVVLLAWTLLARLDPSPRWIVAVAVLVGIGLSVLVVGAPRGLDVQTDAGSVEVRAQRLELLTTSAAEQPVTGLGVGAVDALGLQTTDSSYLQLYGELGVMGVGLLLVAIVAGLGAATPALVVPGRHRPLVVALSLGALSLVAGSFAYDALTLSGSGRLVWVLLGAAGALASVRLRPFVVSRTRAGAAVGVVLASVLVATLVPSVASVEVRYVTVPTILESGGGDPVVPYGRTWSATTCEVVRDVALRAGLSSRCRDEGGAAGMGRFRLAGATPDVLRATVAYIGDQLTSSGAVPGYRALTLSPAGVARPVWVVTAPVTAGLVALGLLVVPSSEAAVPVRRRRGSVPA